MSANEQPLPAVIIGTGASARLAAEALAAQGRTVYGFLQTEKGAKATEELNDFPVLGAVTDAAYQKMLKNEKLDYVLGESEGSARKALQAKLFDLTKRLPLTVVHPQAWVSPHADVAAGVFIGAGCVVSPNSQVDQGAWLAAGTLVDTDAHIGEFATLGIGCKVGASARLEADVMLGVGVSVMGKVVIGKGAQVGAGSAVLRAIPAGKTAFGVPAELIVAGK